MLTVLTKGHIVTLLTSYCAEESEHCTDRHPCPDCIRMCNQFELMDDVVVEYKHEVGR